MSQQKTTERTGTVSQTVTETVPPTTTTTAQPILRLPAVQPPRNAVTWDEKVIDNEHLNRKKTKICCIFHPADDHGECDSNSSSDDSSSDSSDNEQDDKNNNKKEEMPKKSKPNAYEVQPHYTNQSKVPSK